MEQVVLIRCPIVNEKRAVLGVNLPTPATQMPLSAEFRSEQSNKTKTENAHFTLSDRIQATPIDSIIREHSRNKSIEKEFVPDTPLFHFESPVSQMSIMRA